jgi:hypothetical protein
MIQRGDSVDDDVRIDALASKQLLDDFVELGLGNLELDRRDVVEGREAVDQRFLQADPVLRLDFGDMIGKSADPRFV